MLTATSRVEFLRVTGTEQLAVVEVLARQIWQEYYVPLIGQPQVDYMVAKFQTVAAMQEQILQGYHYYLIQCDSKFSGYIAVQPQPSQRRMFISKFYLLGAMRGRGTGRAAMEFIEQLARTLGLPLLWLTVNKGNRAVHAYERLGFRIAEDIVMDIGEGFVMDDYRMEKMLDRLGESD